MAEPDNTGPDEAGADKTGADKTGADKAGADKTGTDKTGAAKAGAGETGAAKAGAGKSGADKAGAGKSGAGEAGADKEGPGKADADKTPEGKSQSPAGSRAGSQAGSRASAPEGTAGTGEQSAAAGARASRATLKLHHLRPAPGAHRDKNRKGRGEASKGKTAGRGTKGTRARDTVPPGFEGGQMPLHRRVPKLKGFSNSAFKTTYQVVNLDRLTALYPSGGDVTPDDLAARGAVRKGVPVKILGTGEAGANLRVTAHAFSGSAREKITAAGGSVTEL